MSRKNRVLPVLASNGVISRGTQIEIVPEAMPADLSVRDPDLYRATIDNPEGLKESILWAYDKQLYSLTELTVMLWEDHGIEWIRNFIFVHWRRVGATESLWDEAERFAR